MKRFANVILMLVLLFGLCSCSSISSVISNGTAETYEPCENSFECSISVECSSVFNNMSELDSAKLEVLPPDGIILKEQSVTVYKGESVWDVLSRVCREQGIHLEASNTPMYNGVYIEGIGNLYEFDCGPLSGWTYLVNGQSPNYGCSRYVLSEGDSVQWRYTCDLGKDVGAEGGGNSK